MSMYANLDHVNTAFGIPAVLTQSEALNITSHLSTLWRLSYRRPPGDIAADLELCRRYFDPTVRGHKLRERLAELQEVPEKTWRAGMRFGPPLVFVAGKQRLLVGVEARIALQMLSARTGQRDHIVLTPEELRAAENHALETYRTWSLKRFLDVVALSSGEGREVLQAIAVGVVLALLVNRSTSPSRAVIRLKDSQAAGQVDLAIFRSADRFASVITTRANRSSEELTLRGGYAVSEARRRLAGRLKLVPAPDLSGELLYITEDEESDVVSFLGRDLARRVLLSDEALEKGFDQLVQTFRSDAGKLANRSMVFERASDTVRLKERLLDAFREARS